MFSSKVFSEELVLLCLSRLLGGGRRRILCRFSADSFALVEMCPERLSLCLKSQTKILWSHGYCQLVLGTGTCLFCLYSTGKIYHRCISSKPVTIYYRRVKQNESNVRKSQIKGEALRLLSTNSSNALLKKKLHNSNSDYRTEVIQITFQNILSQNLYLLKES